VRVTAMRASDFYGPKTPTPVLSTMGRHRPLEIGQKPGVVRGTGSSNPSPSCGESTANLPHTVRQGCLGPEVEARSYSKIFFSLLLDTVLGSPVGQNRGVNPLMRAFRIFRRGAVEAPRGARAQQLHFTPMLRLGWPATFADPAQAPDR